MQTLNCLAFVHDKKNEVRVGVKARVRARVRVRVRIRVRIRVRVRVRVRKEVTTRRPPRRRLSCSVVGVSHDLGRGGDPSGHQAREHHAP